MDELEKELRELKQSLSMHIEEELVRDTKMESQISSLAMQVDNLNNSITSLLNLWEQARGMVTLIKWCSAIGGVILSLYTFLKGR